FLLVPWFDVMIPVMDLKFRTEDPTSLILFFVGLLVSVGLISGAYPAFYISKFDTITIFKGKEKFGSKNLFSKIMLGVQFFLAVMTIVGCFIMFEQSVYLGSKDWGYDPTGTMSVYVTGDEQYELLKNEVLSHPDVSEYTASDFLIGRGVPSVSLELEDKQFAVRQFGVSEGYFETFGLRLIEGRPLTNQVSDQKSGVIVNEKFVEAMDWSGSAVGKTFMHDSLQRTVLGVVENFHYYDFFSEVDPVMIKGLDEERVRYLTLRTNAESLEGLEDYTRTAWHRIAPNDPFDRVFQEDVFNNFYQENDANISILALITVIAIILACLGLYGLLSFNVQGKLKEFSVRKVLGAKPKTIVGIVSKQYLWVLIISFAIGAPLGSLGMMKLVVSIFPDPTTVTALPFIIAMTIILVTLIITVAGQVSKAINVNPAELLRSE
ncbi:MAG: FtsX-like permease family protein, partial [Bacteroidota bacterium]